MTQTVKPPVPSGSLDSARRLRSDQTDAEQRLWSKLRASQLVGLKFRRQHPIPPYVADFYCHSLGLVVEIGGSQHSPQVDLARTKYLESQGVSLLRFNSNDVLTQTDAVLEAILNIVVSRTLTPTPLPAGEGL